MEDGEWIWGRRPVLEALAAGRVRYVLISETAKPSGIVSEIEAAARSRHIPVKRIPSADVERYAPHQRTQGVVAKIVPPANATIDEVLAVAQQRNEPPFALVLDQIQDPHNLGSLLRSAEVAGVHGVIIPQRRSSGITDVVAKTSAGAAHHLAVATVSNLVRALIALKERGLWIVGLDMEAPQTLYTADLTIPLALVIGGEERGLRRLTREQVEIMVRIPLKGKVASLNAAVAGAIAMFEVVRQRDRR
jgi:23S rRNA (guanosine2251-2'-O)-methyltransferase